MNISFKGPIIITKSSCPTGKDNEGGGSKIISVNPTDIVVEVSHKKNTITEGTQFTNQISIYNKNMQLITDLKKNTPKMSNKEYEEYVKKFKGNPEKDMEEDIVITLSKSIESDDRNEFNLNEFLDYYA